jgi:hypothetical protein
MAIISSNPEKEYPIDYTIGEENGMSEAFVALLHYLPDRLKVLASQ